VAVQAISLFAPKAINLDMEDVMMNSDLIVLLLMLPVVVQIIIPLSILVAFGPLRAYDVMAKRRELEKEKREQKKEKISGEPVLSKA
jgi:hypothetical protein